MATQQPKPDQGDGEKLQKVLAAQGFGSRRQMENWITEGRVLVNGQTAHLGQRVVKQDQLEVDGQTVSERRSNAPQILLLNKAGGTVCSRRDPESVLPYLISSAAARGSLDHCRSARHGYHRVVAADQ